MLAGAAAVRPLAIELVFDAASDARLRRVWAELAARTGPPRGGELGTAPHVTLALFRGAAPAVDASTPHTALAGRNPSISLELSDLDRYQTPAGVV
jgi:hypothetical protein